MIAEERQTKIETNIDQELKLITNEIANKQLNQFSNIYLNKIKKRFRLMNFDKYILVVAGEPNSVS